MLKICLFVFLCIGQLRVSNCENDGISLAFVIDDTGSMTDDIDQVKTQVDSIFDAALKSNGSLIKDFILYTFNDPTTKLRAQTLDRDVFKKELAAIVVDGGEDCPEMALTGLQQALEISKNGSIVYLFTDAGAKDHEKYQTVKGLAKEKNSKLNFILTGTCYGQDESEEHRVYFKLAEDTQGQVFSLFKKEVGQILHYARESIAAAAYGAPAVLYAESVSSSTDVVSFNATEDLKNLLISVSGPSPQVTVTDPKGGTPKTEDVAKTSGATVVKVLDVTPGLYRVSVNSSGPSRVVVTGINASGSTSKIIEE